MTIKNSQLRNAMKELAESKAGVKKRLAHLSLVGETCSRIAVSRLATPIVRVVGAAVAAWSETLALTEDALEAIADGVSVAGCPDSDEAAEALQALGDHDKLPKKGPLSAVN